jgi:prolyl 4-hydroxylase
LQLVSYTQNQSYHFHTDWFTNPSQAGPEVGYNRRSSFFAYVDVKEGTTGGGTNFPLLDAPKLSPSGDKWCEFIDCDEPYERGVTFRPIAGNAVFWVNMIDDGTGRGNMVGDERVLHAGLPVTSGGKLGMNIWTREGPLNDNIRGVDEDA